MKKKIIWGVGALLLLASVGYFVSTGNQAVVVEMTTVEKGTIEKVVEEKAEVKIKDQTDVYSLASGVVTQVNVAVGDSVKKGDVLVLLDDKNMKLQIEELESQIISANAQYAEAKAPSQSSEISKLNALVSSAQMAFEEAKKSVANNLLLYESGGVSQDVYQAALTDLATKEAALISAKYNLSVAKSGLSDNVKTQYSAQLEGLQVNLERLEKQLSDFQMTAPADGIILTLDIDEGAYIQPGMMVLKIGNTQHLFLTTDVLVEEMSGVAVGTEVYIENKDLGIVDHMGKVSKIYPMAFDKQSELGIMQKRVTVEIDLNDQLVDLKPGYEVTAKMVVESHEDVLLIDKKAIFDYQGTDHVFVNVEGVARLREITSGIEGEELTEITEGLNEADQVILSPDDTIKEGLKIK